MIFCRCGGLICNTSQTQARDRNKFLQSKSGLSCGEEETSRRGKFTWLEAMVKKYTIEIEARKAMSLGHCQAELNEPLNQGPITR
ncbi:hypothetical protein AMTRI_Chr11g154570 [Amborella trichopoda]